MYHAESGMYAADSALEVGIIITDEMGWESEEQFERETGVKIVDLVNVWFTVSHDRVYTEPMT